MALVLASSSSPPPVNEVVLEFDATHCMSVVRGMGELGGRDNFFQGNASGKRLLFSLFVLVFSVLASFFPSLSYFFASPCKGLLSGLVQLLWLR
jgi:hypothetical protein